MARNIDVTRLDQVPVEKQFNEMVERKGIGHPDSVADGLAEAVSRALCKEYIKRYGRILHHNTDECQVIAGLAIPRFGGGVVMQPVKIILVGRATSEVSSDRIPVGTTALQAARDYLRRTFPNMNLDSQVTIQTEIGTGSLDLRQLFDSAGIPKANDTSFGAGYAPMSELDRLVLESERFINGALKRDVPEFGQDVKVMGSRRGDKITLTISAAAIDSKVPDLGHYLKAKATLASRIKEMAVKYTKREVEVFVNTADDEKNGIVFLTVTGLSMENADDGSVGRGNRVNGLITPFRPMSMEASAGKNPVTHVGKIYNLLAFKIAEDIYKAAGGEIAEVYVKILSQIGSPIDHPGMVSVQLVPNGNVDPMKYKGEAQAIADDWLANISRITDMVINEQIAVF